MALSARDNVASGRQRQRIIVQGIVQGVGFRPFVYSVALREGLVGFVLNDSRGVVIEIEGASAVVADFARALREEAPPLARIDALLIESLPLADDATFTIEESAQGAGGSTVIPPDAAICGDCLRELFDPNDRRYLYPFINCTNCGPRFTIIEDVPYDRAKTTMRAFPLCDECRAEYDEPRNRRFFAQPNTCPTCGPRVQLLDAQGAPCGGDQPIAEAAHLLAAGRVLAIKGAGGYYLACDAYDEAALRRLRDCTRSPGDPLAVMAAGVETIRHVCEVAVEEVALLESRQRPIVLLKRRVGESAQALPALAGSELGVVMPATPMQYVLLEAFGTAIGPHRQPLLAMTTARGAGGAAIIGDRVAKSSLLSIVDGMLSHNRRIAVQCANSVTSVIDKREQIARRALGYTPLPIALAIGSPKALLACGAERKNTFCLVSGSRAIVSQPLADLGHPGAAFAYRRVIAHFRRLFDISPAVIAHDLDLTPVRQRALARAVRTGARWIGVQHQHAHIASVLAEHGLTGPVIGVTAEGDEQGAEQRERTCEVAIVDFVSFERRACLAPLPVMRSSPGYEGFGGLFDAVAHMLGLAHAQQTSLARGWGMLALEAVAEAAHDPYRFSLNDGAPAFFQIPDVFAVIAADLRQGVPISRIAGRLHVTIAEMLASACRKAQEATGIGIVAVSGDAFMNRLLLGQTMHALELAGFRVYINQQVPPHDGGLSLGQGAIAAAQLQRAKVRRAARRA